MLLVNYCNLCRPKNYKKLYLWSVKTFFGLFQSLKLFSFCCHSSSCLANLCFNKYIFFCGQIIFLLKWRSGVILHFLEKVFYFILKFVLLLYSFNISYTVGSEQFTGYFSKLRKCEKKVFFCNSSTYFMYSCTVCTEVVIRSLFL